MPFQVPSCPFAINLRLSAGGHRFLNPCGLPDAGMSKRDVCIQRFKRAVHLSKVVRNLQPLWVERHAPCRDDPCTQRALRANSRATRVSPLRSPPEACSLSPQAYPPQASSFSPPDYGLRSTDYLFNPQTCLPAHIIQ
jgi:hypothetical protein